jgi:hypothetical protein
MSDLSAIHVFPSTRPLVLSLPVTPEEIELALATNGESLRLKAIMELLSELVTGEVPVCDDALAQYLPWANTDAFAD